LVETTGTIGQRFGANKRFGALIGVLMTGMAAELRSGAGTDAINNNGAPGAAFFDGDDLRNYRYYRSRWGLAAARLQTRGGFQSLPSRVLFRL